MSSFTHVGPHGFAPLRWWRNRKRCSACYLPESAHPIRGWVPARPMGDKTKARDNPENWGRRVHVPPEEGAR